MQITTDRLEPRLQLARWINEPWVWQHQRVGNRDCQVPIHFNRMDQTFKLIDWAKKQPWWDVCYEGEVCSASTVHDQLCNELAEETITQQTWMNHVLRNVFAAYLAQ